MITIREYRTLTTGRREYVSSVTIPERHRRRIENAYREAWESVRESGLRGGVVVERGGRELDDIEVGEIIEG